MEQETFMLWCWEGQPQLLEKAQFWIPGDMHMEQLRPGSWQMAFL